MFDLTLPIFYILNFFGNIYILIRYCDAIYINISHRLLEIRQRVALTATRCRRLKYSETKGGRDVIVIAAVDADVAGVPVAAAEQDGRFTCSVCRGGL